MHYLLASLSSTSSAESINDPGFPLNGKSKGGDVGLDGDATVTFSHHYSEKAPSIGKKFVRNAFIEESRTKHSSNTGILGFASHYFFPCERLLSLRHWQDLFSTCPYLLFVLYIYISKATINQLIGYLLMRRFTRKKKKKTNTHTRTTKNPLYLYLYLSPLLLQTLILQLEHQLRLFH